MGGAPAGFALGRDGLSGSQVLRRTVYQNLLRKASTRLDGLVATSRADGDVLAKVSQPELNRQEILDGSTADVMRGC